MLGQLLDPLHGHLGTAGRGDVVDHDGYGDGAGHRFVVREEVRPPRWLVEGRDHHHGGGAYALGVLAQLDRLLGREGTSLRDHGHRAGRRLSDDLRDTLAFLGRKGGELAGTAARDQAADPGSDEPGHQRAQRSLVDRTVVRERGHQCRQYALQLLGVTHGSSSFWPGVGTLGRCGPRRRVAALTRAHYRRLKETTCEASRERRAPWPGPRRRRPPT